jgi:hypothetical protein
MGGVFDGLYSRFILRDFFGKIVPGAIPVMVLYYTLGTNQSFSVKDIPLEVWVLLYGVSWITGFAIQSIGEWLHDHCEKLGIRYHTQQTEELFYDLRIKACASAAPFERQEIERTIVIKEATGNTSIAILVSLIFWMLWILWRILSNELCWRQILWPNGPIFFLLLGGFLSLARMHTECVGRQDKLMERIAAYREKNPFPNEYE